jgi:hypothetical protein
LGIASFSVTASSGTTMSYQWYLNGAPISGATDRTYSFLVLLGLGSGNYCVKVSNASGYVMSDNATLNVVAPPAIITQPQSQSTPLGQLATFTIVASGTGPLNYQWFRNGTSLGSDGRSATLTLNGVQTNQAGSYKAVVTNSLGAVTSAVATLTILMPPSITTQPQSQSATQGQTVAFSAVASGSGALIYSWSLNGSMLARATNASLVVTNIQDFNCGSYSLTVSNAYGTATSSNANLTMVYVPSITVPPTNQAVIKGHTLSLSVVAIGSNPLQFKWVQNGNVLSGATNSSLTISNVSNGSAGSYVAIVTNSYGSVTSSVAAVSVFNQLQITKEPASQSVTAGDNVRLSVNASGNAPLQYQWYFSGNAIPGATNSAVLMKGLQLSNAGDYSAVVSDITGALPSSVATVTIAAPAPALTGAACAAYGSDGSPCFSFQVPTAAGFTYVVQATTDMQNWTPVWTNIAAVAGTVTFVDTNSPQFPSRMYRVCVHQ